MGFPSEFVSVCQYKSYIDEPFYYLGGLKIILKEGVSMEKRIAKTGMEDLFELVNQKIATLEVEKADALEVAKRKIEEEFAERENTFNSMLEQTSELIEEPEEVVDGTETAEEQVVDNATENPVIE